MQPTAGAVLAQGLARVVADLVGIGAESNEAKGEDTHPCTNTALQGLTLCSSLSSVSTLRMFACIALRASNTSAGGGGAFGSGKFANCGGETCQMGNKTCIHTLHAHLQVLWSGRGVWHINLR